MTAAWAAVWTSIASAAASTWAVYFSSRAVHTGDMIATAQFRPVLYPLYKTEWEPEIVLANATQSPAVEVRVHFKSPHGAPVIRDVAPVALNSPVRILDGAAIRDGSVQVTFSDVFGNRWLTSFLVRMEGHTVHLEGFETNPIKKPSRWRLWRRTARQTNVPTRSSF